MIIIHWLTWIQETQTRAFVFEENENQVKMDTTTDLMIWAPFVLQVPGMISGTATDNIKFREYDYRHDICVFRASNIAIVYVD